MWKNMKYCFISTPIQYSNINCDVFKQIISILKIKPVNHCSCIRHQTTDTKSKVASFTIAKRPPMSYLKDIQVKKEKPKKNVAGGEWLLLTIPIFTFGLGTWQVQRRKWKMSLIEDLEKRTSEPPIDFPDDLAELSNLEYRKVKIKGKFDHSHELYLGPRTLILKGEAATRSGIIGSDSRKVGGHCVITPFVLSDSGKRILVNRGWVPASSILPGKRVSGQIEDEVEIIGVVRLQEQRGTFVPENKPHLNLFHYRDVKKMAKKCQTLRVMIDATEDSTVPGGPIGGQTNVSIRNEHMSYIITWYSLSALTGFLWCKKFLFR